MFIQDRVIIEEIATLCLSVCVCVRACVWTVECRWPSFFSFKVNRFLVAVAPHCPIKTHFFCKIFLCETRHLMLLGCMLEYLKGKTHEQEEKPSAKFLRSHFC
ncbi:hypothetical protein CHARACLAT_006536 [Characodon lateralis]|uniref:Secreted protein n=1 Tax=Characodon lateralis TaxID=208331 RepID=A0ABU7F0S9_9TELE|nr:hypothetical protein [Characodon lateralis]